MAGNLKISVNGKAWPVASSPGYELAHGVRLTRCPLTPERVRDALAMKKA